MIGDSWTWNLIGGALLVLIAVTAHREAKSSALVSKALLLWPALVVGLGIETFVQGWSTLGFSVTVLLGGILILCGIQAVLVNIRKLSPWPSGAIWLLLIPVGTGFQFYPFFEQRIMGWLWTAVGITKVMRERSASLETGTPSWILLLYAQAILLASYR